MGNNTITIDGTEPERTRSLSETRDELMRTIRFREELEALGVVFVNSEPTNGWAPCYAVGRDDAKPSAAVNMTNGYYLDSGRGLKYDFWQLLQAIGAFPSFKEAIAFFADKYGVEYNPTAKRSRTKPADAIDIVPWNGNGDRFCEIKHCTRDAIERAGGGLCRHNDAYTCVYLPVESPDPEQLDNGEPVGYIVMQTNGRELPINAKGGTSKVKIVRGTANGLVGVEGLRLMNEARRNNRQQDVTVIKTEGVTDMLAVMAIIPDSLRGHVAVITNKSGATEAQDPAWIDLFKGFVVNIIHDCDAPGQRGATNWTRWLGSHGIASRNVILPFSISENHGKDLRDYISKGKSFDDLTGLIDKAPIVHEAEVVALEYADSADRLARHFLESRFKIENFPLYGLIYMSQSFYTWGGGAWRYISETDVKSALWGSTSELFKSDYIENLAAWEESKDGANPPKVQRVTNKIISDAFSAVRVMVMRERTDAAEMFWLIAPPNGYEDCRDLVPTTQYIYNPRRCVAGWDYVIPANPGLFTQSRIDAVFDERLDSYYICNVIGEMVQDEPEKLLAIQEMFGICLTMDMRYQTFYVLQGEGGNGKSVVAAMLTALLSMDNVSSVPLELMGDRFAMNSMRGKLANIVDDISDVDKICEGKLKNYVSGAIMGTDRKNKEGITFLPTATLIYLCNQRPRFSDKSDGLWRRLSLIPFNLTIPENRRNREFTDFHYWEQFRNQLFAFAFAGLCRLVQRNCSLRTAQMEAACDEYKVDVNPILDFFSDYIVAANDVVSSKQVYTMYCTWCTQNNMRPMNSRLFGKELKRNFPNIERRQRGSGFDREWVYCGISLSNQFLDINSNDSYGSF